MPLFFRGCIIWVKVWGHLLLGALFGGIVVSVGIRLIFKGNASTDDTNLLA